MIKLCIVVNSLMFGGVEKVIENYYKDYDKSKFDITLIAQDNSVAEDIALFKKMGMRVKIVPHKRKRLFKNYFAVKKILKENRFDIVHSNMSFTNCYVLRLAKKYRAKIRINHYHNVFAFKGLKARIVKYLNKLCDKYSTHNFFCSDAVERYFGKTKRPSLVIRNALQLERYKFDAESRIALRKELGITPEQYLIGQVGRLTRQKNQEFTLKVFAGLTEYGDGFRLVIIGDGEDKERLISLAEETAVRDKVVFLPACKDIEKYYSAFDAVALPSLYEGLGIVAIESSISGAVTLVSSAFPREVDISDNIVRLDISEEEWIKTLAQKPYADREGADLSLYAEKGFDITAERRKLFSFFENNL